MPIMKRLKQATLTIIAIKGFIFILVIIFISSYYDNDQKPQTELGHQRERKSRSLFAHLGFQDSLSYMDPDYTELDVNANLTKHEIRFFPPFPKVWKGKPGNDFENLTLKMDSVKESVCNNSTFIIVVIPSSAKNFNDRQFIRKSWGSSDLFYYTRLRTVFLVGATVNQTLQDHLEREARRYGDILQMNFIDSYRNLTYKTMAALLWISENCKEVPWILKADDDVVLNPFNMRNFLLKELKKDPCPNIIYGRLRPHSQPFRDGKWGITKDEYRNRFYPPFVLGSAYIIGKGAVDELIRAAYETPFFPLEDVFTTGMAGKKAKVTLKNIERTHFVSSSFTLLYKGRVIFLVGQNIKKRKRVWDRIKVYKKSYF